MDRSQEGEAAAVADVEGFAGDAFDLLESAEVGMGNIEDVDVIADAGSVGRGVVRAEDIGVRQAAGGGIEDAGNDVSFDAMMLAAFLGGSSGVEIAEGDVVESGIELVIGENLFEYELGFSVGVDGRLAMVFGNRNDFGFAISGGGGRKNELLDAVAGDGIEQVHTAGDVGGVENTGLADGFCDEGLGGEVHDRVHFVLGGDALPVRALNESNT